MARPNWTRYSVTLPPPVEMDLNKLSKELGITKSEALRRSIMLFKHAVTAKKVLLTYDDKPEQTVLVK